VAFAVLEGEKADRQTGYSHLWHAAACVLFLIAYEIPASARTIGRMPSKKLRREPARFPCRLPPPSYPRARAR
jgi:hypothetical protein